MAHKLVGQVVALTRPVVVKPGFTRQNEEDGKPEHVEAVIKMETVPGTVVGVEPRFDADGESLCPNLHIAYLDPSQLHHLGGSGWRDSFTKAESVRPKSHPDVLDSDEEHLAYYESEDTEDECADIREARRLAQAKADAKAKKAADAAAKAAAEKATADAKAAEEKAAADAKAAEEAKKAGK